MSSLLYEVFLFYTAQMSLNLRHFKQNTIEKLKPDKVSDFKLIFFECCFPKSKKKNVRTKRKKSGDFYQVYGF